MSFSSPLYTFYSPGIKNRDGKIEMPVFLYGSKKMNETMVFENLISRNIPIRKTKVVHAGFLPSLDVSGKEKVFRELNNDPDVLFAFKEYLEGDIC
ncbi:MAG: hypothetical protein WC379_06340 [Methanoregula sp.]